MLQQHDRDDVDETVVPVLVAPALTAMQWSRP
jgi:hypothetical protein